MKIRLLIVCAISLLRFESESAGQTTLSQQPDPNATPIVITLDDAIRRAQVIDPNFAAASTNRGAATLDRSLARSALLPQAIYHNEYIYTQPNGDIPSAESGSTYSEHAEIYCQ